MDKLIKEFLANKNLRNKKLLALLIAGVASVGQPWA